MCGKVQRGLPSSPSTSVVTCRLLRVTPLHTPHSPGRRKLSVFEEKKIPKNMWDSSHRKATAEIICGVSVYGTGQFNRSQCD